MNAKSANAIPINTYLQHIGIYPKQNLGGYLMYKSMIRLGDDKPSLKVDLKLNLWVDYGSSNQGGSLIDLVLQMYQNFTVSDAIKNIAETIDELNPNSFSLQEQKTCDSVEEKTYQILKVKPLENKVLLAYSNSRGIKEQLAKNYFKEVYYKSSSGKRFFALGIQNEAGGWNLRNKYHKNILGNNSYTLLKGSGNSKHTLNVVEGMFDALSLITVNNEFAAFFDVLILNSCINVGKTKDVLAQYENVKLCLDNDLTGQKTTELLISTALPHQAIIDCADQFKPYIDVNEYLINNLKKYQNENN